MRPTWHWTERSPWGISARNPSPNSPSVCGSSYSFQATLKYCTRLLTITRPLMLLWPLDRKLPSEFLSRRGMTIRFRHSRCYIHIMLIYMHCYVSCSNCQFGRTVYFSCLGISQHCTRVGTRRTVASRVRNMDEEWGVRSHEGWESGRTRERTCSWTKSEHSR